MSVGFPWDVLGMGGPGDRRAVKRAYAVQLKSCRPEDDAAGFSRLRQAYETALHWGADAEDEPISTIPFVESSSGLLEPFPSAPGEIPTAAEKIQFGQTGQPTPPFPYDDCDYPARAEVLLCLEPEALSQQLHADDALWNLDNKDRLSMALAMRVVGEPDAVSLENVRILTAFFHWDDVASWRRLAGSHVPVASLHLVIQAAQLRQSIAEGAPSAPSMAGSLIRWGVGPMAWGYALWWKGPANARSCLSSYPPLVARLVFGPRVVGFWDWLGHGVGRFALHLLRMNLILLTLVLLVRSPGYGEASMSLFLESLAVPAKTVNALALCVFCLGVALRWQALPVDHPVPSGWSRRYRVSSLIAVLAFAGVLAAFLPATVTTALAMAVVGLASLTLLMLMPPLVWSLTAIVITGAGIRAATGVPLIKSLVERNLNFDWPWLGVVLTALLIVTAEMAVREGILALRLPATKLPSGLLASAWLMVVWLCAQLL